MAAGRTEETGSRGALALFAGLIAFFQAYGAAITPPAARGVAESFDIGSSESVVTQSMFILGFAGLLGVLVAASADRVGRRRIALVGAACFGIFTAATSLAGSIAQFQSLQFLAGVFRTATYVAALTMVAEEYTAGRRGRAIGSLTALSALGIAAASLYPLAGEVEGSWRGLYLVGGVPLLVALFAGHWVRETARFVRAARTRERRRAPAVFGRKYRGQFFQVGALFFFSNFAFQGAVPWWTYFANRERGISSGRIAGYLAGAYLAAAVGSYLAGALGDRKGRRPTGTLWLLAAVLPGAVMFRAEGAAGLLASIIIAFFFGAGSSAITNAYASELFPIEVRASAIAFCRVIFGTAGGILGPLSVLYGARVGAEVGDRAWLLALGYLPAVFILRLLPETAGRELEDITAAAEIPAVVEAPYAFSVRTTYPPEPPH